MFTSGELERVSMALDEPMKELEMRIMQDVVRRIKINGEITAAADWQINRLQQLGMSKEEVNAAIQEALSYSDEDMNELYSKVIGAGYTRDKALYEATGTPFIPFEENGELQQLISSVSDQTNQTLHNITQSLGFAERGTNGKISFTPLADFYQKTLDSAMLDISSGAFDYNTVLKRTVKAMTDSGLRTVDYASGHSNRVDVAARRAVMTGMTQLTAKVNEDNAEQLGTDMFEVSWHGGARPEHQVWQGKWYTKAQLETVCGLGTVTGLCGANCYHEYNPVIPGISEPTYTAEELEELNRQENEPVEWKGKQYTKYEALQRQRRLETTMRAQRQEMALLKKGEADEDDLINCRAKYRVTSAEYTRFSEAMGLPQQRERVSADGLGNIMQGKYTKGSGKPSPVSVPAVGAKVTDKVTAEERKELLSRNPVNVHNSSVDKSGESGIIEVGKNYGKYRGQLDVPYEGMISSKDLDEFNKNALNSIMEETGFSEKEAREAQSAIVEWCGDDYKSFTNGQQKDKEKIINNCLSRMGAYDGEIQRGLSFSDPNDGAEFINAEVGKTVSMKSVSAWSNDSGVASRYAGKSGSDCDSVVLVCDDNKSAVGVQHISKWGTFEAEVLSPSTAEWEVTEKTVISKYDYLKNEVLPNTKIPPKKKMLEKRLKDEENILKTRTITILRVKEV